MSIENELVTAQQVAQDLEDLDVISGALGRDKLLQQRLAALRERRIAQSRTVRLAVAAQMLDLSVPTVRAWARQGVLAEGGDATHRRVTLESVLALKPIVSELRGLGQQRGLLEAVLARLDDRATLSDPQLIKSIKQMGRGEGVDITPSKSRASA